MNTIRESRSLFLIITLGCLLRLLYAFGVPQELSSWGDSHHYVSVAKNIATDFRYANSWTPPENHPRFGDLGVTSYREPFYPLLLALQFNVFGDSSRITFALQALLGTLIIPLCFGVARQLTSSRAALLGAMLESVNPYHIYYTAMIATETITSLILISVVYLALCIFRSIGAGDPISRNHFTLLILALSAGILTRAVFVPVALTTVIFIGVALYRKCGALAAGRTVGLLALLTVLCVSPWFIRNYVVWHAFVYQTNMGHNLVMGYNDLATGGYEHSRALEIDIEAARYGYNELERDRIFKQEAFQWISAHPGKAIYLSLKKQLLFWSPVPATLRGYERHFGIFWASTFLALTVIGIVRARAESFALKYAIAVIVVYALVHSVALAFTRYRIPLDTVLAVFAGYGLDMFPTARMGGRQGTLSDALPLVRA
jgi:4-amino-4-deoxy-L-arabinose transferase-like glycosyltransferase